MPVFLFSNISRLLSDGLDELGFRKVLELGGGVSYDNDYHVVGIEILGGLGLQVLEGNVIDNGLFGGDEVVRKIVVPDAGKEADEALDGLERGGIGPEHCALHVVELVLGVCFAEAVDDLLEQGDGFLGGAALDA